MQTPESIKALALRDGQAWTSTPLQNREGSQV